MVIPEEIRNSSDIFVVTNYFEKVLTGKYITIKNRGNIFDIFKITNVLTAKIRDMFETYLLNIVCNLEAIDANDKDSVSNITKSAVSLLIGAIDINVFDSIDEARLFVSLSGGRHLNGISFVNSEYLTFSEFMKDKYISYTTTKGHGIPSWVYHLLSKLWGISYERWEHLTIKVSNFRRISIVSNTLFCDIEISDENDSLVASRKPARYLDTFSGFEDDMVEFAYSNDEV